MHREESKVYANKEGSEMNLSQNLIVSNSKDFISSIVEAGKDGKYCPHGKNIVEVGHNVVGIVESNIKTRIGENNAGYSADCEQENEPYCKQQGGYKTKGTPPHRSQSAENFNSSRNSNNHGRCGEVSTGIHI